MARAERSALYRYGLWPDQELLSAVIAFRGDFLVILRVEQRLASPETLIVDLTDTNFLTDGTVPEFRHHRRVLRLTWTDRVYALETYDEFYAGPYGTYHPTRQGLPPGGLYEVVNDPNPWITELLDENHNTDVFPPYGVPAQVSEHYRQEQAAAGIVLEPTGRFFPPSTTLEPGGQIHVLLGQPPNPAAWAAEREAHRRAMLARPRWRHLLLGLGSVVLEVLGEGLPRWQVLEAPLP